MLDCTKEVVLKTNFFLIIVSPPQGPQTNPISIQQRTSAKFYIVINVYTISPLTVILQTVKTQLSGILNFQHHVETSNW